MLAKKKKMVINMLVLYPEARKEKRTKHGNDIFPIQCEN